MRSTSVRKLIVSVSIKPSTSFYSQMAQRQLNFNTHADERVQTRKMKANQGISRLTLGEIGNRVSTVTVDPFNGQSFKKNVLQIGGEILTQGQMAKPSKAISSVSTASSKVTGVGHKVSNSRVGFKIVENKENQWNVAAIKDHRVLPKASKVTEGDIMLATLNHSLATMDISTDETDAFSIAGFTEQIEDIDAEDMLNPQSVSIYVNSIYSYMRQLEKKFSIRENYLEGTELTGKMRGILIDWLCQVHNKFHLLQETFYLTVAIIDRYLQIKPCKRSRLQLVGVSAMLVASKYEEMYAPEVADFVYITDNAYSRQDVRDMEQDILRTLDFSFGRPSCLHFLRRNSKAGQVPAKTHMLAKYLMELTVVEYDMAHLSPSLVSAAALHLSMLVNDNASWTPALQFYSSYPTKQLLPVVHSLAHLAVKAETSKLTAVRTKYSSTKFMKIAAIPELKSRILIDLASLDNAKKM